MSRVEDLTAAEAGLLSEELLGATAVGADAVAAMLADLQTVTIAGRIAASSSATMACGKRSACSGRSSRATPGST